MSDDAPHALHQRFLNTESSPLPMQPSQPSQPSQLPQPAAPPAGSTGDMPLPPPGSDARLRLIVESARDFAIISMDLDRVVQTWNTGAELLLGHAENEIVGRSADVIFTEEDRAAKVPALEAGLALRDGRAEDERWHQRKDGSIFWGSGTMTPLRGPNDEPIGLVKVFRDRTAERAARLALEKSEADLGNALRENEAVRAQLEAASQAKDQLLAIISHELRTPLTPVMVAIEYLARRQDLPAEVSDTFDMIRRNLQIEARFIEDLLDATRIASGKFDVVRRPLDLHDVMKAAVAVVTPHFEEKQQRITVDLAATRTRIEGDATRLQQAIWNLLTNASKFTSEGGAIVLHSHNDGPRIIIEVKDTGLGMAADAQERIFQPFAQADSSISRMFGGLGLGLSISRSSIEAHGGVLRAWSAGPGHGSTFWIELPVDA